MKNKMRIPVMLLLFSSLFVEAFSQQKVVQYSKDFLFRDGVYLTFQDFKNNNPILPSKIIFNSNKDDNNFLKYVLNKTTFTYLDGLGKEVVHKTEETWGYCSNGTVYINHGTDFNRVNIIGSICHFVATVPVKVGFSDPFYNNQPFDDRQQYAYVTEQQVIDLESGKVMPFDVVNMETLLSRDESLFEEFGALSKKKKRDMVFLYLRKYNEKHVPNFPQ